MFLDIKDAELSKVARDMGLTESANNMSLTSESVKNIFESRGYKVIVKENTDTNTVVVKRVIIG